MEAGVSGLEEPVRALGGTFAAGCCAERLERVLRDDAVVKPASGAGRDALH